MHSINPHHPLAALLRIATAAKAIARRTGQEVLAVLFNDMLRLGGETREVTEEIATDASALAAEIRAAAADGKFTAAECARLVAGAEEIERQAVTGRIERAGK
jgi:cobyrinic acid a,c-diamide synthase